MNNCTLCTADAFREYSCYLTIREIYDTFSLHGVCVRVCVHAGMCADDQEGFNHACTVTENPVKLPRAKGEAVAFVPRPSLSDQGIDFKKQGNINECEQTSPDVEKQYARVNANQEDTQIHPCSQSVVSIADQQRGLQKDPIAFDEDPWVLDAYAWYCAEEEGQISLDEEIDRICGAECSDLPTGASSSSAKIPATQPPPAICPSCKSSVVKDVVLRQALAEASFALAADASDDEVAGESVVLCATCGQAKYM